MAGSGVHVDDEVSETVSQMRNGKKYRFVVLGLTEDLKEVKVMKKSNPNAAYDEFVNDMKEAECLGQCRYAIYDYPFCTKGGVDKQKLVFVAWSPDGARVKQKMVYSATKEAVKKKLGDMVGINLQATDQDEISEKNMGEQVMKFERA